MASKCIVSLSHAYIFDSFGEIKIYEFYILGYICLDERFQVLGS